MLELFRIIIKYSGFILFVIFEIIAFTLIIKFNQPQKEIFNYSSNQLSGRVNEKVDDFSQYFDLQEINEKLNSENAKLFNEVQRLKTELANKKTISPDSIELFEVNGCRVISNSITKRNNFFMLNCGADDGIKKGMGVLYNGVPVGHITKVSGAYARAISLLNTDFSISAKIKNKNYLGNASWVPQNPNRGMLLNVPHHADVSIGDTVVTNGYSLVFPAGLNIGRISEIDLESGSNYYEIVIDFFADMSQLDFVFISNFIDQNEIDSLSQ